MLVSKNKLAEKRNLGPFETPVIELAAKTIEKCSRKLTCRCSADFQIARPCWAAMICPVPLSPKTFRREVRLMRRGGDGATIGPRRYAPLRRGLTSPRDRLVRLADVAPNTARLRERGRRHGRQGEHHHGARCHRRPKA